MPFSRSELEELIGAGLADADDSVREAWGRIRIQPEKWRCSPWGELGGGFWAVAISDGFVTWYNDIEGGFNRSRFSERGVIDEYHCNQSEFSMVLGDLPEASDAEAFAQEKPAITVPYEFAGPGRIERRQTTYWVLRSRGAEVKVHFSGKQETRFVEADYELAEALDVHPILSEYQESWSSLFVSSAQNTPPETVERLMASVVATTNGWRSLDDYRQGTSLGALLRGGYGLIMRAPVSVVRGVAETLVGFGVSPSIVGEWKERSTEGPHRVLLVGRNFVVARSFRFEAVGKTHEAS